MIHFRGADHSWPLLTMRLVLQAVALLATVIGLAKASALSESHADSEINEISISTRVVVSEAEPHPELEGAGPNEAEGLKLFELLPSTLRAKLELTSERNASFRTLLTKVKRTVISHRPRAGETLILAGETVQAAFQRIGVQTRVASRVQVVALPASDERGLRSLLKKRIEQSCEPCAVELSGLQIPQIDYSRVKALRGLDQVISLRGPFTHPLDVEWIDDTTSRVFLVGRAELDQEVLLLKRPVTAGEQVVPEHLEKVKRRMTFSRGHLTDPNEVIGFVYSRSLGAGEILRKDVLKKEIVIRNGEPVRVHYVTENFEIAADGVAAGQGAIGDRLSVRVGSSGKTVGAIVRGRGRVDVQ